MTELGPDALLPPESAEAPKPNRLCHLGKIVFNKTY